MQLSRLNFYLHLILIFFALAANGQNSEATIVEELKDMSLSDSFIISRYNELGRKYLKSIKRHHTSREYIKYKTIYTIDSLLSVGNSLKSYQKNESVRLLYDFDIEEIKILDNLSALALLRIGEERNCCARPDINFCTFPISPKFSYIDTNITAIAIDSFNSFIEKYPNDVFFRWGLVLAQMTSGIEPEYTYDINQEDSLLTINFTNKAHYLGIDIYDLSGGSIIDDFNNDGFLDIICSVFPQGNMNFFLNNGMGGFDDITKQSGLVGQTGGLHICQVDYNNDGWLDVFVPRGAWLSEEGNKPNSLLRNNGDMTFTDVTREVGLYCKHPTQVSVWADFNLDGRLDLFIGNEANRINNTASQFYINTESEIFLEVTDSLSIRVEGYIKGASVGYANDDLLPDLYVSDIKGKNRLFINTSNGNEISFVEDSNGQLENPIQSFACWFWDVDNNGVEDIYASNYKLNYNSMMSELLNSSKKPSPKNISGVYLNSEKYQYTEASEKLKLDKVLFSMGANFDDFDNNGFLDLYCGTGAPSFKATVPNRLFLNNGEVFNEYTSQSGLGHLQKGHAISVGDLDNDGDQDIYTVMGGFLTGDKFYNACYINDCNQKFDKHWVVLRFRGSESNYYGVGNKIKVTITDGVTTKYIYRTVNTGGSFGASSLQAEIGFDAEYKIDSIEIIWPASGIKQVFSEVKENSCYLIKEKSNLITAQKYTALQF